MLKDESIFDLMFGTETRQMIPVHKLTTDGDRSNAEPYQATSWTTLKKVFSYLIASSQIDPLKTTLLDFGCGKGRVMLAALHFGIQTVYGVDFDHVLCGLCEKNITQYVARRKLRGRADWKVFHADATQFEIPKNINVCFLYNPFTGSTLEKVVQRLSDYCRTSDKCIIIYVNPIQAHTFEECGFLTSYQSAGEFIIYKSEGSTTGRES